MFYTYIIESLTSGKWYYGHAVDLDRRLHEHNTGRTTSTRNKGPWRFIFIRPFATKTQANQFELHLKKLRNKDFITKEFGQFFVD
jgi:putative endonuclease